MTLFRSLKDRGLEGVELVISDAHEGILGQSWRASPTRTNRRSPIS